MSLKVMLKKIDVLTFFEDGKIDPIKFRMNGRVYPVKRIHKKWIEEENGNPLHNFIVQSDNNNFQIQFDTSQFTWGLRPFTEAIN
ncbi:MAG: hypothetical protein ACRBF0_13270 [Calditrichia bacterium]